MKKPPFQAANEPSNDSSDEVMLNKFLSNSGVASRRKSAELIKNGDVTVNGTVIREPFFRVTNDDKVLYKGKIVNPKKNLVYILLNKPRNCITTTDDPQGRKTVLDIVKKASPERIFPVGRLDRDTTGLLLITNDGDLAVKLTHPRYKVTKTYHVTLDKPLAEEDLQRIKEGLTLEDGFAPVDGLEYAKNGEKNEVGIEIHIGKNRIVRRIFKHLGYHVAKLDRVYYAGMTKKDVPRGKFRFLSEKEIIVLKHFAARK